MSNPSKAKGTAFETLVAGFLKGAGLPHVERRALNGNTDKGDIAGIPGVVLECKNCRTMDLSGWLNEAKVEAINAEVGVYAVVHKRSGKSDPGEQYVTMPLYVFARLIA